MGARIGVIGSSAGSAFQAALECSRAAGIDLDLAVLSDRPCGLMDWARAQHYPCHFVDYSTAEQFSAGAAAWFHDQGVSEILLFYTRRVTKPLIDGFRVFNIHPSLLPAFRGLGSVQQALRAGVHLLGASLHVVDMGIDTGPLVMQVACELPLNTTLAHAQRLSYQQKVWLTLHWFELVSPEQCTREESAEQIIGGDAGPAVQLSSPHLASKKLERCFCEWQRVTNLTASSEGDAR